MAQDPWKIDQVQIEPGSAGSRLIRRASDGSLEFIDARVTGGITLLQLAGLKSMQNVLVVGKAGAGADYTSVQSALDAIPAASSPANPYLVLIGPGVYRETINIARDGVTLLGMGAVLQSLVEATPDAPGAYHTVVIQSALGTVPHKVTLVNLDITNAHNNYACLRVSGGAVSEVGDTDIRLVNCKLRATSAGGNYTVWANSVNYIVLEGGSMAGCTSGALVRIEECAAFVADHVIDLPALVLDWDATGVLPSETHAGYQLFGCPSVAVGSSLTPKVSSELSGGGVLEMFGCSGAPTMSLTGDQSVLITGSVIGDLVLDDTINVRISGSSHGTITPGATATLAEPVRRGSVSLVGELTKAVVFDIPQPDTNYTVMMELLGAPANQDTPWVTAKVASGFTINFSAAQTLSVNWSVQRVM